MIIICGGTKGGTGKSTILIHLATMAASEGSCVLIIDADSQASLLSWSDARNGYTKPLPKIVTVGLRGAHIGTEIAKMSGDYDYIFVDCDGQDASSQRSALVVADKFITTFSPRAQDIWTAELTAALVRAAKIVNTGLTAMSVLNRCDARGKENAEAESALAEFADAIPLVGRIGDRKALALTFQDGIGLIEQARPNRKALTELQMIWNIAKG